MNLDHIKNKVKVFKKDDRVLIYVQPRSINKSTTGIGRTLFDIQHRLRVRQALFGYMFTSYHLEMDFTLALNSGWVEIK